ncbi:fasciclin domain-containing protein [Zhouia amylolytica]|uniref:fasciclin domain-containing protein n=1 Tax=Zhouia amylolytica TaxID=376730 RepID=UPI0020CDD166|nr:fasciclin domain-containing protein [Zhouia amylolytica]MCQ0112758.1 fasciclin domain-containing protein [Zhouia amylolytica]
MKNVVALGILSIMLIFTSCEKESIDEQLITADINARASVAAEKGDQSIAEIVVSNATDEEEPQFTLLLAALEYAGITSMFTGNDQYTVFAPTDAAFVRFLGDNALTDFTPDQVASVLSYHVTDGRRFSNSVVPKQNPREIETLLGYSIFVSNTAGIDTNDDDTEANATILVSEGLFNISASNGVIHVIDEVLVPESE